MPVVIQGMHRSGTSAITRCINLMGASMGREDDLIPADRLNERGYWEHSSLMRINDNVLAAWDGIWFAPPDWPDGWLEDERLSQLRKRAAETLRRVFPDDGWVWKDPRNCLTFRFWREVLPVPLCIVFVWRDPVETWRSLQRGHGLEAHVGALLWILYNRSALVDSAGLPTFVISYAELLNDTWAVLERLRVFLIENGVKLSPAVPRDEVRSFLDPSLRHHKSDGPGSGGEPAGFVEQQAMLAYLRQLPETHASLSPQNLPKLPAFAHEILGVRQRYSRINLQLAEMSATCGERDRELADLRHTNTELRQELSSARALRDERDRQLADATTTNTELHRQLSDAQTTLDTIYRSKAWRALQAYRKVKYGAIRLSRCAARGDHESTKAAD